MALYWHRLLSGTCIDGNENVGSSPTLAAIFPLTKSVGVLYYRPMIESILTAPFSFGTIWFWIIALTASIIFIASVENDHWLTPTITAIVLGIIYWNQLMAVGWQTIVLTIAGYVLAGVLWSLFKWYRHVSKKAAYYHEKYGNTMLPALYSELRSAVSVSSNKSRLTGWIAWWPWSLVWALTGDFFNFLYDMMVNAYQKIANRALGKFTVQEPERTKKSVVTDAGIDYS